MKPTLLLLMALAGCNKGVAPKPRATLVHLPGGGSYVHLDCPDGWKGDTTWHTYSGMSDDDQTAQYFRDATRGVCKRELAK